MTEYYLWLLQLMGAANPRSLQLIQYFGSAKSAYDAIVTDKRIDILNSSEKKKLSSATLENSKRLISYCERKKIKIATLDSQEYPYRLRNIYNAPLLLFYKGSLDGLNDEICICGVGARSATEYTAKVATRTCTDLAKVGVVLISGMAVGVDHIVHQAAVECGARTVGVLACGLDVDYPKGSIPLRERIYQNGGACISELFPQESTSRTYFQERNRLMSGLSNGVIIFQAGMKSGSLITAEHAVQQGRDLFCVPPHDVFSSDYAGVIRYLRDGAIPLFNYLDVVNNYYGEFSDKSRLVDRELYKVNPENHFIFTRSESEAPAKKEPKKKTKTPDSPPPEPEKPVERDFSSFDGDYRRVLELLSGGEKTLEELTSESKISPADIPEILLELEISGVIRSGAGARYSLK